MRTHAFTAKTKNKNKTKQNKKQKNLLNLRRRTASPECAGQAPGTSIEKILLKVAHWVRTKVMFLCATSSLAMGPLADGNNQCYIYLSHKGKSLIIIQRYQITSTCAVACTQCGIKLHIRVSDYIGHCTTKRLSEDINPMTQHT